MKTSDEVKIEFMTKLDALLNEYNADIEIIDTDCGYYQDYNMEIFIPTKWDGTTEISESVNINLGKYYK